MPGARSRVRFLVARTLITILESQHSVSTRASTGCPSQLAGMSQAEACALPVTLLERVPEPHDSPRAVAVSRCPSILTMNDPNTIWRVDISKMTALSHSTSRSSSDAASQLIPTEVFNRISVGSATMAVVASADCSNAAATSLPHPRTPISAPCGTCSHPARSQVKVDTPDIESRRSASMTTARQHPESATSHHPRRSGDTGPLPTDPQP